MNSTTAPEALAPEAQASEPAPETTSPAAGLAPGTADGIPVPATPESTPEPPPNREPVRPTVGERVGAIIEIDREAKSIRFLGYGTYDGDLPCPHMDDQPNPRITLENGDVVWGCECHWGPAQKVADMITKQGLTIVNVTIDQVKREAKEAEEKFEAARKEAEAEIEKIKAAPKRIDELEAMVRELGERLQKLERKAKR